MFNANYRKAYGLSSFDSFCAHLFISVLLLLNGCAITPDSIVKQPTTARAIEPRMVAASSGAIYNAAAYRPLFEDRRPRMIGDIVTINITENTSATKAGASSSSKDGKINSSISSLFGTPIPKATIAASSATSYADKDAANSSNVFNGSITATVIDVLPNGYLLVGGEKQIAFDKGTEFVRFSGVVNPDTITQGNVVASTKVADARIEYRTNSRLDAAQIASMLIRFFLSLSTL
jgi:flagellar L-ring protein precursor FlgH